MVRLMCAHSIHIQGGTSYVVGYRQKNGEARGPANTPYEGVRFAMRSLSQSSTSDSNHPTREGPSCTRLGNLPAASSRAICAGEYRTFSRTCLFDNIRIAMLPVGRRCNASVSQGVTSIPLPKSFEVGGPLLPRFLSLGKVFGTVVHGHNAFHPVMEHLFDYVGCYA